MARRVCLGQPCPRRARVGEPSMQWASSPLWVNLSRFGLSMRGASDWRGRALHRCGARPVSAIGVSA